MPLTVSTAFERRLATQDCPECAFCSSVHRLQSPLDNQELRVVGELLMRDPGGGADTARPLGLARRGGIRDDVIAGGGLDR